MLSCIRSFCYSLLLLLLLVVVVVVLFLFDCYFLSIQEINQKTNTPIFLRHFTKQAFLHSKSVTLRARHPPPSIHEYISETNVTVKVYCQLSITVSQRLKSTQQFLTYLIDLVIQWLPACSVVPNIIF